MNAGSFPYSRASLMLEASSRFGAASFTVAAAANSVMHMFDN